VSIGQGGAVANPQSGGVIAAAADVRPRRLAAIAQASFLPEPASYFTW
jgi:hypothetical protein